MRLISHGHAAVVLEHDGRRLAIDPGTLADADAALDGTTAVLLTHEHPDHVDAGAIRSRLAADDEVRIWAPGPVADALRTDASADVAARIHTVEPGERFDVDGFDVVVGGGWHAVIHDALPRAVNVTYLVIADGAVVYHPGDSFEGPPSGPDLPAPGVLLVPVSGPWLKLGEAMDFATAIDAPVVVPIHGALLSDAGWALVSARLDSARIAGTYAYRQLAAGESIDVDAT